MSFACSQCGGTGGYTTPGNQPVSAVISADEAVNPIQSGVASVKCRQCNGTGVTLACGA